MNYDAVGKHVSWFADVKRSPAVRRLIGPMHRAATASGYVLPPCGRALTWLLRSREWTNFTYDLTTKNIEYLCTTLAIVTGTDAGTLRSYVDEVSTDKALQAHVASVTQASSNRYQADLPARFCKRLGWYAVVRATKPRLIVETGVDKGLGSVVLCAALLRNVAEGRPGAYVGTDINPKAGYLLSGPYASVGEIRVGDSLETLARLDQPVDVFVNDSDHSAEYEYREYQVIAKTLSERSILIGDNAHVTDCLWRFSRESGRSFLFWKEEPRDHWYPGGGIGFSWRPRGSAG